MLINRNSEGLISREPLLSRRGFTSLCLVCLLASGQDHLLKNILSFNCSSVCPGSTSLEAGQISISFTGIEIAPAMWEKPYIFPLSNPAFVKHSSLRSYSSRIWSLLQTDLCFAFSFPALKKGIDLNFTTSIQKREVACSKKDVSKAVKKCE